MAIATNRKARHDYEILETLEAGLVLSGDEVKSVKAGAVNLKGAFIVFRGDEAFVTNMHVSPYARGRQEGVDPTRTRKLLLHKKQINHLRAKREADRLTVVPLAVYLSHNRVKLEIALARGKRKYEKRDSIKKRDLDRAIRRNLEG